MAVRIFGLVTSLVVWASAILAPAQAQTEWQPTSPIHILVGFGPGSSTDVLSRLIGDRLSARLGQPVVIDNRPGVAGSLASEAAAKSTPDGQTLIMLTGAHTVVPAMNRQLPYDPIKDFSMISLVASYPLVVAIAAKSPIRDLKDLIARAKSKSNSVSFATTGYGSGQHLIGEMINAEASVEMLHVPMRGGSSVLTEVLAGRVDITIDSFAGSFPQIQAGNLRAIAVTSLQRHKQLPDVPSVAEIVPGVEFESFNGLAAAAKTPPGVIRRLNREVQAILTEPEVQTRLSALGVTPNPSTPEQATAVFESAITKWNKVVATRNIERR